MPTVKQKLVFGKIQENPRISIFRAMVDVGYSPYTASDPQKNLLQTKGFQELAEEYLPDDLLLGALQTDIKSKVGNRKAELELAFKVKGQLTEQPKPAGGDTYQTFIQQNNIDPNTPTARKLVETTLTTLMEQTKRVSNGSETK